MEPGRGRRGPGALESTYPDLDYTVDFEASADFEEHGAASAAGGTLDASVAAGRDDRRNYVPNGAVSLEDLGIDIDALNAQMSELFVAVGEVDGRMATSRRTSTSRAWSGARRTTSTRATPTTFDGLTPRTRSSPNRASRQAVLSPRGERSGRHGLMEDIMLRTAGPDVYDQWVKHEIPFNDPAVANAATIFGDVMFAGNVLGGADQTPAIAFGDAPSPMFDDPPGCWLHRQAELHQRLLPGGRGSQGLRLFFPRSIRRGSCTAERCGRVPERSGGRGLPEQVHQRRLPVRDGRRDGLVAISPSAGVGPDYYVN